MASNATVFSLIVIGLGILIAFRKEFWIFSSNLVMWKQDVNLAICILSARNHFEHRAAIRNTWLSEIRGMETAGQKVVAKFVVGQNACNIHPENRLDPHDCKRWEPTLPDDHLEVKAFVIATAPESVKKMKKSQVITQHLYVKVMSDIILKRLGILNFSPFADLQHNQTLRVVLYDAATEEEITHTAFSRNQKGVELGGYTYRPVEEIMLPKVGKGTIIESSAS